MHGRVDNHFPLPVVDEVIFNTTMRFALNVFIFHLIVDVRNNFDLSCGFWGKLLLLWMGDIEIGGLLLIVTRLG